MEIKQALQTLLEKRSLSGEQMRDMMHLIMTGQASDAQIAAILVALRCKGETVEEIAAAAQVMRDLADHVSVTGEHVIDTCGTGGDGAHTFNISTTAAFVAAAAGAQVAKHGNRSVSSSSGSADVLEAAGVNLDLGTEQVSQCINTIGIGFLFAPKHHGAMKHTIGPRREMGVRTLFNLLGPLSNPASAPNQLIGVFGKEWLRPMAEVLKKLGSRHVLVVNAEDGLDEISIACSTHVAELKNGNINCYSITPVQFGLKRGQLSDLIVDDAASSLKMMKQVLDNQPGSARDIVALNAGAAIYAANLSDNLQFGVQKALQVIASGAAKAKLDALVEFSNNITNKSS
ncbi:MAG: anthranilate phosphoribosyltransferase [Methylicorpusculum sp.]|uniref:anthranilate phosphoribosyltransferase n=1 Tax=Methylicorpusculum sp. TaxID=2713644 RepID=UPI00272658C3|nr:anthranilate phosphoribosyltransferase [Methylicorpusculum sp.]MDO8940013.1 anthranilate phosphoribosyltransferase [Methylicorpusculum sp.]MDO9238653.1 anthranilate phosphoribosyltransferase [Methylicorpusculum sp.]MDP2180404.1 anthranilate phosphoribosyltransferase [Methylicorpusculum sp.]MDP2203141.1 anthranilate phosphoribosyltransferase [Methylicorpusculum sp.]MDP3530803.1 anthranilate phosphoribosyltransferase [Methylicorpusculum sp.]